VKSVHRSSPRRILVSIHLALLVTITANGIWIASQIWAWSPPNSVPELIGATIGAVFLLACVVVGSFVAAGLWLWTIGSSRWLLLMWDVASIATFGILAWLVKGSLELADAFSFLVTRFPWLGGPIAFGVAGVVTVLLVAPAVRRKHADSRPQR
jgi:hypothetical protein